MRMPNSFFIVLAAVCSVAAACGTAASGIYLVYGDQQQVIVCLLYTILLNQTGNWFEQKAKEQSHA